MFLMFLHSYAFGLKKIGSNNSFEGVSVTAVILVPGACCVDKAGFMSAQREERKTPSGGGTLDPKTPGRVIGSRVPPPRRREGRHRRCHP